MVIIQSDVRSALQIASTTRQFRPVNRASISLADTTRFPTVSLRLPKIRALSTNEAGTQNTVLKAASKPPTCTADELHYVSVNNSDWRLSLWRYHPPPLAPRKNRPLLLLSGVATNAIGYDLSPESSFARYMCGEGFDTWVLEVRGAGLSTQGSDSKQIEESSFELSEQLQAAAGSATEGIYSSIQESTNKISTPKEDNGSPVAKQEPTGIATKWDESKLVTTLTETFMRLSEGLSGFLSEGQSRLISAKLFDQISRLLEDSYVYERLNEIRARLLSLLESRQNSAVASQMKELSQKVVNIFEEGQRSVSPQIFDLQERLTMTIDDFQKQLDLIVKYDWDFDHYLEEDVPAAIAYIKEHTNSKDGKIFAIGHSMGGILLYAMLSRCGCDERDSGLAAVVTLASSLDYTTSKSTLKLLIPLADPAQALNVPVVPVGALLTAAYPLSSRSPYILAWLNNLISAEGMMHPELLKKLILNNFCTVPAKVLLQLTTVFKETGLCNRDGTFFYNDHLSKTDVPVLAIAADRDSICPPEAVHKTAKLFPENLVTYKVFGDDNGLHYAHYDLVGGRKAVEEVYPCIVEFLSQYDSSSSSS